MIQKCVNHLNAHLLPSNWIAFIKLCDTTNQICFPAVELPSVSLYCTNSIWCYNKKKNEGHLCEIVLFVSFKGVSGSFIHYHITELLLYLNVNFIFTAVYIEAGKYELSKPLSLLSSFLCNHSLRLF